MADKEHEKERNYYDMVTAPVSNDYQPTEMEEKFLHGVVELGMKARDAWEYAGNPHNTSKKPYRRLRQLAPVVNRLVSNKLVSHAPVALNVLRDLMEREDATDAIKLKAATEWLDRSGWSKTIEMRVSEGEKPVNELSKEELEQKMAVLLKNTYKSMRNRGIGFNLEDDEDIEDADVRSIE